jgi:hypothetical protein
MNYSTVVLKLWDLCHLKDIVLGYSQDFESQHLHAQIIFYWISKFTEKSNSTEHFKNKNDNGPDLPETGRNGQIRPRSAATRAGEGIQMANRRGPVVSGSRGPNRYAPFLAVRSSRDRRPAFVVSATEEQNGGEARVWSGFTGGSLIRLKRIYNFWCSMLVFTPFAYCFVILRGTFMHFPELTY